MAIKDIFNCIIIDSKTITAGQPSEEQLAECAEAGVSTVINLAPISPRYSLADEEKTCVDLGMTYIHIPVDWDQPREEDYQHFVEEMQGLGDQKLLIHCAANYRVSAFYSVYARHFLGWSSDRAKKLRASIWESNPKWSMDESWRSLIEKIDR